MGMHGTGEGTLEEGDSRGRGGDGRREPYLFLLLEGTRPLAGGARYALGAADAVTIGRAESRAARRLVQDGERIVALGVPDRRMSNTHARLSRRGDRFVVADEGSRNGSRVNGHPLRAPAVLGDGDLLETGRTLFLFRAALASGGESAPDLDAADVGAELATMVPEHAAANAALEKVARSRVPVLVLGPTGAGKERVARAVHAWSGRAGRFVPVNTGALPSTLVESQLFGHVRGAFTGALADEPGFVRSADCGTLFLDEIGDLPAPAQAALLRVLQEGEVVPLGSTRAVPVDVRVVAATNADLEARCKRGGFREDLLARLAGFTFAVPPLRGRREDLGLLVKSLLARTHSAKDPQLSAGAARAIALYAWPRNVRELEQALASASVLAAPDGVIELAHLPPAVAAMATPRGAPPAAVTEGPDDEAPVRQELIALLVQHRGNVSDVARAMGKARMQIHRWVKRFRIDLATFRRG